MESGGTITGETGGNGTVVSAPKITTESLSSGTVGTTYSQALAATGENITWSVTSGNLPTGLDLSGNTISGTPTTAGTSTFTVKAENSAGSDSKEYTLTIQSATVPVTGVSLDKTTLELYTGNTETLTAKDGSTVKITLRTNQTKLDKEVFEELAGRDVTLEISLSNGVTWTVNGQDIPADAKLSDLDLGVTLDTSTIPVSVINTITRTVDTIQISLKHDGEFGFTMTLSAPQGQATRAQAAVMLMRFCEEYVVW